MRIIDLSLGIETNIPTCGTAWHQTVLVEPVGKLCEVGRNTHRIVLGSHSATHMDAPYHFIPNGKTMEKLDLNKMIGKTTIVDFRQFKAGAVVSLDDIKKITISPRLLFVFGWYHHWQTDNYYKNFPYFSIDAVNYLIENGLEFMAMDTPSPDYSGAIYKTDSSEDSPNHKKLLLNEVVIAEYLNNTEALLDGREYEIIALPLKLIGSDGSPARIIAREIIK